MTDASNGTRITVLPDCQSDVHADINATESPANPAAGASSSTGAIVGINFFLGMNVEVHKRPENCAHSLNDMRISEPRAPDVMPDLQFSSEILSAVNMLNHVPVSRPEPVTFVNGITS